MVEPWPGTRRAVWCQWSGGRWGGWWLWGWTLCPLVSLWGSWSRAAGPPLPPAHSLPDTIIITTTAERESDNITRWDFVGEFWTIFACCQVSPYYAPPAHVLHTHMQYQVNRYWYYAPNWEKLLREEFASFREHFLCKFFGRNTIKMVEQAVNSPPPPNHWVFSLKCPHYSVNVCEDVCRLLDIVPVSSWVWGGGSLWSWQRAQGHWEAGSFPPTDLPDSVETRQDSLTHCLWPSTLTR